MDGSILQWFHSIEIYLEISCSQKEFIIDKSVGGEIALHEPLMVELEDELGEDPGQEDGLVAALQDHEPEVQQVDLTCEQEPLVALQEGSGELMGIVAKEHGQRLIKDLVGWTTKQLRPAAPRNDLVAGLLNFLEVQTKGVGHVFVLLFEVVVVVHLELRHRLVDERINYLVLSEHSPDSLQVNFIELVPHNARDDEFKRLGCLTIILLKPSTSGIV